jgi:hypothetical protein
MDMDSNMLPSTASVADNKTSERHRRTAIDIASQSHGRISVSAHFTRHTRLQNTSSQHHEKTKRPNGAITIPSFIMDEAQHIPSKQADTIVSRNTALTMADTPTHLPSESKEDSQTRTPTPSSSRRINKLSDATLNSLSVTRASQEKGAIRELGESNLPHRAQKIKKWTIIRKDHEHKMHRYARRSMANDAPTAAPTENGNDATNTPPQAKPARLGWGTPHHHVGINPPSHQTNGAPKPAAHKPAHISPLKVAAKPLFEYRSDASNTDDEYYDFAEGGFY